MREIQSIKNRMGGEPTFKNRRLTISSMLAGLADGCSIEEWAEDFRIDQDCIKNALLDIADNIREWMRPERTWELWEDQDVVGSTTFSPSEGITKMLNRGLIGKNPNRLWTVKARSTIEAMTKYHEYMGWEPYKPMLDKDGNTHPEDEGDII